jgi:hypothetical protein
MVDDDGTGTTGTVINAAWKTEFYDQIDAAIGAVSGGAPAPIEGTFLPTITADGSSSGQTYVSQSGRYCQIGKQVVGGGAFQLSAKGTFTGNLVIKFNLPGGLKPNHAGAAPVGYFSGLTAVTTGLFLQLVSGLDICYFYRIPGAGSTASNLITPADFGNDLTVQFSFAFVAA